MSNQKLLPCLKCGTDEFLAVYTYDSGWKHVECDKCFYLGPGCGSKKQAIIEHNIHCRAMPAAGPVIHLDIRERDAPTVMATERVTK